MRRINEISWFFINLALTVIIGIILFTGKIYLFLSPRVIPMVWFGFVVFLILFVFNLINLKSKLNIKTTEKFKLKYLLFIIPIVLYFFTTPTSDSISALPDQNLNLSYAQALDTNKPSASSPIVTLKPTATPAPTGDKQEQQVDNTQEAVEVEETIEAPDLSYMSDCKIIERAEDAVIHTEFDVYIKKSLDEILGEEISMYGFVYKEDSFPENTILVSRLLINCCAADATLVGFHIKVENADDFEADEWIEVTGTIDKFPLNYYGKEYEFPIMIEGTIIKCEKPELSDWYIYP